jgi:hypothetical protein
VPQIPQWAFTTSSDGGGDGSSGAQKPYSSSATGKEYNVVTKLPRMSTSSDAPSEYEYEE